jgi:hypothetical protein
MAELSFPDPIEHATGEEKVMLLLEERGITVSKFHVVKAAVRSDALQNRIRTIWSRWSGDPGQRTTLSSSPHLNPNVWSDVCVRRMRLTFVTCGSIRATPADANAVTG